MAIRPDGGAPDRRPRGPAGAAVIVVLALLVAGCTGGGTGTSQLSPAANAGTATSGGAGTAAALRVRITPANGAAHADPSAGITVTSSGGALTHVIVRTSGDPVTGSLSRGGTLWRSQWALDVSRAYTVTAGNTKTHRTQIYYDGKLRYNWPISSGRPGDATPDGSYLTIEKANPVLMTGPGYSLEVPYSVRFTFSGDYYHDAYWSAGEQGFENVSHGCVNLSPADAEIYYNLAVPGDPITIVGSPKAGTWDNGWTEWFLSWSQYLKGSALHEAVQAGPDGSTFVNPSTLPPDGATSPLQTSPANNATAA